MGIDKNKQKTFGEIDKNREKIEQRGRNRESENGKTGRTIRKMETQIEKMQKIEKMGKNREKGQK